MFGLTQASIRRKHVLIFSGSSVNPIYYVFFSTATILASLILFRGLNTDGGVNTISLICGFLTTFLGVYLLNLSRSIPSSTDTLPVNASRHSRRISHSTLETGFLNPRISITSDRHGRGSFDSLPTDDEEAYPLRNKGINGTHSSDSRRQSGSTRSPIAGYNHQHGANGGVYSPVLGSDRRKSSPTDVVFDIGDDDDMHSSSKRLH
jgi:hypothetical protein